MSFTDTKTRGNGILEFRLEIEGFDYQFGTHSAMNKTTSQYQLLGGTLSKEDLIINYDLDYLNAKINANSISFRLIDKQGLVTAALVRLPTKRTQLIGNVNTNEVTFTVSSVQGWSNGDLFFIGNEAVTIGTVNAATNQFESCTRAQLNSSAQKHVSVSDFGSTLQKIISDIPLNLKGRKVTLYAYGKFDDFQGNGTQIWRGILDYEFSLEDATTYVLNAYPITELFKSKVGEGLQEFPVRGIYHPDDFPLQITVTRRNDNTAEIPLPLGVYANQFTIKISGFFSTADELVNELNLHVQASGSDWPHQPSFLISHDGFLSLQYTLPTSDNKAVVAFTQDAINPENEIAFEKFDNKFWQVDFTQTPNVETETTVTAVGSSYIQRCKEVVSDRLSIFYANSPSRNLTQTNPATTIYVDTDYFPTSINSTRLVPEDENLSSIGLQTYTVDNTNGRLTNIRLSPETNLGFTTPLVVVDKNYQFQIGIRLLESGSFGQFLQSLINNSPTYFGEGFFPIVTLNDIDINEVNRQLLRYQGGPYFSERSFEFFKSGKSLEDIIAEECKLNGMVPSFSSQGKFIIKRFKPNSLTDPSTFSASYSDIVSIPNLERGDENLKNNAILHLNYDPVKDEFKDKIQVKYRESVIYTGLVDDWEISPFSLPTREISLAEVRRILVSPIYLYGTPATKISFEIPFKYYGIAPGDSIALTSVLVPNIQTSKRGVTDLICLVQSVSYDLNSGIGSIIALYFGDFRGYSPSCEIISASFQGSNTWNMHVSGNYYSVSGNIDSSFFEVGMEVEAVRYGDWNPVRVSGSITAIPSNDFITVQFDSNNASLSGTIFSGTILRYQNRNNLANDTAGTNQQKYVYISTGSAVGSGGIIYDTWTAELGV